MYKNRPPLEMDMHQPKDRFVGFYAPAGLAERIQAEARRDNRSVSGWLRHQLQQITEAQPKHDERPRSAGLAASSASVRERHH